LLISNKEQTNRLHFFALSLDGGKDEKYAAAE